MGEIAYHFITKKYGVPFMTNADPADNVYVIDTRMFGFSRYCSAFLIAGNEIALIDTGPATSAEFVRAGIEAHGFALEDISYILITHIHFDHSGAAGILLKEMPKAKVMIHPRVLKHIIDPSIVNANIKRDTGEIMSARFGELVPIPPSRVQSLANGEVLDLGNGKRLRITFAPGHHSSEIVILDEKNMGLFAGDAPGLYFADEDIVLMPSPPGCDLKQSMETLKVLMSMSPTKLFLGHYGICDEPQEMMRRALDAVQLLSDVGFEAIEQGKQEELASRIIASIARDIEKLGLREKSLYPYIVEELIPVWARGFIGYYQTLQKNIKC